MRISRFQQTRAERPVHLDRATDHFLREGCLWGSMGPSWGKPPASAILRFSSQTCVGIEETATRESSERWTNQPTGMPRAFTIAHGVPLHGLPGLHGDALSVLGARQSERTTARTESRAALRSLGDRDAPHGEGRVQNNRRPQENADEPLGGSSVGENRDGRAVIQQRCGD